MEAGFELRFTPPSSSTTRPTSADQASKSSSLRTWIELASAFNYHLGITYNGDEELINLLNGFVAVVLD